jgi:hypothetical protein
VLVIDIGMFPSLLQRGQFYFRQHFQSQPLTVMGALVATVLLIAVASLSVYLHVKASTDHAAKAPAVLHTPLPRPAPQQTLVLPVFDSAALLRQLHQAARVSRFPLDSLTFSLDAASHKPYLRYQVTVTANASYPVFRGFIATLLSQHPHLAIDGLSCSREDIDEEELECQLGLSAFYRAAL